MNSTTADICLILEGSYPYVSGGVSSWTHTLIQGLPEKTFHLVVLVPTEEKRKLKYTLPKNVVGLTHVYLQDLPKTGEALSKSVETKLFETLERTLLQIQFKPKLDLVHELLIMIEPIKHHLSQALLLDSKAAWNMLLRMYRSTVREGSFINYFWSWRTLLSAFSSVMMAPIPPAKIYHTFCTGFAGLYLAKAHLMTKKTCFVTEHGIYTNERRIEISSATWLNEVEAVNFSLEDDAYHLSTKDLWNDTFSGYSKLCYAASEKIITLFKDNQNYQIADGADPKKMLIIPNGIDLNRFSVKGKIRGRRPTIGLVGRVVPIKDMRTFIRAVAYVKKSIPRVKAYIIGPTEEDEEYFLECKEYVEANDLSHTLTFTGKVNVEEYYKKMDVHVLSSISEAQPLSLLEAGASGVPSVATNVGACREILYGTDDEQPNLGRGGLITSLASPQEMAEAICTLLSDQEFYKKCSHTIGKRVSLYYDQNQMLGRYRDLYHEAMR